VRLVRIALRSFRGVHDREVRLAEHGVTVLEGDNEVGKTSTVLALDLLIDQLDSSAKSVVRACEPAGVDAGPEVEAEIVTGAYHFIYRKRWRRQKLTELTVHAPRREQLTGREAHTRVLEMLDETMDRDLWKALRVEQHTPLGQADLGGHAALSRALDRAAAGSDDPGSDDPGSDDPGSDAGDSADDLVERAEREAHRYRTTHERSTGELRTAEQRVEAARAGRERASAAVAAVEADVAERDRLDARLRGLAGERGAHHAAVSALEEQWAATESRRAEVDTARQQADLTAERLAGATARRRARDAAIGNVEAAARTVADAEAAAAEHERRHAGLREHRDARRADRDSARSASVAASAAARDADAALAEDHDRGELADLTDRLARVHDAETGLRAEEHALAAVRLTDAEVDRLEALALDVVRAEAAQDAGAAVLDVSGSGVGTAVEVEIDGERVRLDGARTIAVSRTVSLRVPGVIDVRVRPGHDAHALADAAVAAADARTAACSDAGVADAAEARRVRQEAREATLRRDEHRAVLVRELAGRDADAMRATRATLADRLGDRAGGSAVVLATARDRSAAARAGADAASRTAELADAAWRAADDAVRAGDTDAALLAKALADARHTLDRESADLAAARDRITDAALTADEAGLRTRARTAAAEHERLAAALAEDDPESLEHRVAAARRADERLGVETADYERTRAETTGRLQLAGSEGRHDALAAADGELSAAEADHAAVARRARAASLLARTLHRHRDEVRRAYVAPFRREVERLARIVFGPSLALEVDERLHIVARTLEGVTVAFDELSAGAKEQLGLCARLACAALVDPADGVPVVIDDALGHCDPDRLARLGAVFTAATSTAGHQILVLTCTPERYRGVGAARVVRLQASPTPPAAPVRSVAPTHPPAADDLIEAG